VASLHQTRIEVHDPSVMDRRSGSFETWKLIGSLIPAYSSGMAERCVRQLSPGSGEGQDPAFHVQGHRYLEGAGRPSNQKRGATPGFGPVPVMWS